MQALPICTRGRSLALGLLVLLSGCDIPGLGPDPRQAQREADGKAIGAACRHAVRGIEDCYSLNEKALKTAVFAGWKEMDQYMRENKMEGQPPKVEHSVEEMLDDRKPRPASADKAATAGKSAAEDKKMKSKAIAPAASH